MRCLIAGTAKSGTTALLYTIAQGLGSAQVYCEERIAAMDDLPPRAAVKLILEHESAADVAAFAARFERRVLIVRDPRDCLLSRLLYRVAGAPQLLADEAALYAFAARLRKKQREPAQVGLGELLALAGGADYAARALRAHHALADFMAAHGRDWFILPYEQLVAGELAALEAYLGHRLPRQVRVDPAYRRVARAQGAGDWRHWLGPADVDWLRPQIDPLLARLGYPRRWDLHAAPAIEAEHSWGYLLRLAQERRGHYGLPPLAWPAPCQLCGHGPGEEVLAAGAACPACGAQAGQRALRAVLQALPLGLLNGRRAWQWGRACVHPAWFAAWRAEGAALPSAAELAGLAAGSADCLLLSAAAALGAADAGVQQGFCRLLSGRGVLIAAAAPAPGGMLPALYLLVAQVLEDWSAADVSLCFAFHAEQEAQRWSGYLQAAPSVRRLSLRPPLA